MWLSFSLSRGQVDALAADTQKPKVPNQSSDLEYLLQSEVAQNGNDLLGAVMIHPDQLPEVHPSDKRHNARWTCIGQPSSALEYAPEPSEFR